MTRRLPIAVFLGFCLGLAGALLAGVVAPTPGSLLFAGGLVLYGMVSRGLRCEPGRP